MKKVRFLFWPVLLLCLLLAGIINQRKCAALAGHLKTLEAKEAA